jgi:hypothetical protein
MIRIMLYRTSVLVQKIPKINIKYRKTVLLPILHDQHHIVPYHCAVAVHLIINNMFYHIIVLLQNPYDQHHAVPCHRVLLQDPYDQQHYDAF